MEEKIEIGKKSVLSEKPNIFERRSSEYIDIWQRCYSIDTLIETGPTM